MIEKPSESVIRNALKVGQDIAINEFNKLGKEGQFKEGWPLVETFGDGYGEPYNPERIVVGMLKDGRIVKSKLKYETKK